MSNSSSDEFKPASLLRSEVLGLEPYVPIQPFEVLSERLGIPVSEIIKLDANENPYGPLPSVTEALAGYEYYHIYPDPQQCDLRDGLSDFTGVPAQHILPSHGADELLDYLCRLFLSAGDAVVNCPPTFGMYSFDAQLNGGLVIDVARKAGFTTDVEQIETLVNKSGAGAPQIKIIFLTSPNNPSGNCLSDDDLKRVLALPVVVVLDEAYIEFASQGSRSQWVQRYENLVVLRTFSKAAGIAGLRLGYGICPLWLMEQLWKFKQPYNVNVAASVAGLASLRHKDQIFAVVEKLKTERERLYSLLSAVDFLQPHPSDANFILCDVKAPATGEHLQKFLEQYGVLVRYYNKPGLRNCIRISVGRPEQTDRLLAVLGRYSG